jgi:hypothetical protein
LKALQQKTADYQTIMSLISQRISRETSGLQAREASAGSIKRIAHLKITISKTADLLIIL